MAAEMTQGYQTRSASLGRWQGLGRTGRVTSRAVLPLSSSRRSLLVRLTVAAVITAGLVFRFWTRSPLWLDEALTVNIAKLPLSDIGAALRHDGHPPLYYWLLHGWMAVFGSSNEAVRALSGVMATALMPLVYVAGYRLTPSATANVRRRAGWVCVIVVALNPFVIRYATEARMYAMVMVLGVGLLLLLDNAVKSTTFFRLAAVGITSGALLLTHYWALYYLAVIGLVLVVWAITRPASRPIAVRCAGAVASGLVLFSWWVPAMSDQARHTGTPWAAPANPLTVVVLTLSDTGGLIRVEQQGFALLAAVLLVFGLLGRTTPEGLIIERRVQLDVRLLAIIVAGTMAVGTVAGYASSSTFISRYAAVYMPLLLIVTGLGIARLGNQRWIIGVLVIVSSLGLVAGGRNVKTERTQAGRIAAIINAKGHVGDVVIFCPDQLGPAVNRLLDARFEQSTFPIGASPVLVEWRDYAERNAAGDAFGFARRASARAGAHSVWLIWSDEYRGVQGKCSQIGGQLALERLSGDPLVKPDKTYERAFLSEFAARG